MKKLIFILSLFTIVLTTSCSKIAENNDAVIGIWSDVEVKEANITAKSQTIRKEWIFNDVYLGRYHHKIDGEIDFKTDFKWSYENDVYTISYPGTTMNEQIVTMNTSEGVVILADSKGNIMATRE